MAGRIRRQEQVRRLEVGSHLGEIDHSLLCWGEGQRIWCFALGHWGRGHASEEETSVVRKAVGDKLGIAESVR